MTESRPRNIAQVKVTLGGNVSVCEWPSLSVKDLYRQIFNQNAKYKTYEEAKENGLWYFEDKLTMLDNWVILKYNTKSFIPKESTLSLVNSTVLMATGAKDGAMAVIDNFDTNSLKALITASIRSFQLALNTSGSSVFYPILKNQPWSVDFIINPMDDLTTQAVQSAIIKDENNNIKKDETVDYIIKHTRVSSIEEESRTGGIISYPYKQILMDTDLFSPKLVFNIDKYYFVFDRNTANLLFYEMVDGSLSFIKKMATGYLAVAGGKNQENDDGTPENNKLYTLMFYPLGTKLYVGLGSTDPNKAGNNYISFNDYVDIPAGEILITGYGADAGFTINRLIHEEEGTFSRPPTEINNTSGATLKTALLGQKSNKAATGLTNITSTKEVTVKYPVSTNEIFANNFSYLNENAEYVFVPTKGSGTRNKVAWSYDVVLRSLGNRYYSPAICRTELYIPPYVKTVSQRSRDVSEYVLNASVTLTVEQSSASVTLTNRDMDTENLPTSVFADEYLIWGIRPIKINAAYNSADLNNDAKSLVFKGYTNGEPKMEKSKDTATITLTCFDASQRARESYGLNLPIYDGWCHLAVMRNLMEEAGYTTADSEIIPYEPNQSCYDGHVTYMPDERWHFLMPFHIGENPGFMFAMGTPLWECMSTVKNISYWYLFGRYDGKLVYAPPYKLFQSYGNRFKEVPTTVGNFDEIRRSLSMNVSFSDFRNAIYRSGTIIQTYDGHNVDTLPMIIIMKQKGWPNSIVSEKTFVPWLRWDAAHDHSINDANVLRRIAVSAAKLSGRERRNINFSCWGKRVFPYEIIKIEENVKAETFVNIESASEAYIVTSVSHSFSEGCVWDTSLECELYDKNAFVLYGDTAPEFTEA